MNRYTLSVIAAFATACLATGSQAQQGPPNGLGVNVINTPTVNIGNTPLKVTGSVTTSGSVSLAPGSSVSVVNPANNPAITSSVDDPGRSPYQSFLNKNCAGSECTFAFPAVPAGHRLVIQHVSSGELVFTGTPTGIQISVSGHAFSQSGFLAPFAGQLSLFDQSVLYYFDSGEKPSVFVGPIGTTFLAPFAQFIMLSGYLIDCTVNTCAAIAQ